MANKLLLTGSGSDAMSVSSLGLKWPVHISSSSWNLAQLSGAHTQARLMKDERPRGAESSRALR